MLNFEDRVSLSEAGYLSDGKNEKRAVLLS